MRLCNEQSAGATKRRRYIQPRSFIAAELRVPPPDSSDRLSNGAPDHDHRIRPRATG